MRVSGLPLWTLVLVACIVAPLLIRAWIDAEQRRAKRRTASLLQQVTRVTRDRAPRDGSDMSSDSTDASGPEDAASQAADALPSLPSRTKGIETET